MDAVVDGAERRLLVEYTTLDPARVEPKAMLQDLRTAHMRRDVDRVAVVADADWIDELARITRATDAIDIAGFGTSGGPRPSSGCRLEPSPACYPS